MSFAYPDSRSKGLFNSVVAFRWSGLTFVVMERAFVREAHECLGILGETPTQLSIYIRSRVL